MCERHTSRREFLEVLGAAGAASVLAGRKDAAGSLAENKTQLAIDGGKPIRSATLSSGGPYGPHFYDEVEKQKLVEVLESRSPFRHGGARSKVLQFERVGRVGTQHFSGYNHRHGLEGPL